MLIKNGYDNQVVVLGEPTTVYTKKMPNFITPKPIDEVDASPADPTTQYAAAGVVGAMSVACAAGVVAAAIVGSAATVALLALFAIGFLFFAKFLFDGARDSEKEAVNAEQTQAPTNFSRPDLHGDARPTSHPQAALAQPRG